jgi:SAM-dependent methyltransferase
MSAKNAVPEYVTPRHVERLEDCSFYHTIDLPGLGVQQGSWDLRDDVEQYIGKVPVAGKTVLDVGTGSGFMCFEMEKRGANLIAFDFDARLGEKLHDVVPFHDFEKRFNQTREQFWQNLSGGLDRMKNSFWLSHRLLGSKARAYYGNVYECDADLGPIDIVFMGNILLHLSSPVQALANFAPYARETFIVTEYCAPNIDYRSDDAVCYFVPDARRNDSASAFATWWHVTPGFLKRYLEVLGFKHFELTFHFPRWANPPNPMQHFTLVARR